MLCIKDHRQTVLFDPWNYLSPIRRRMLNESWAGLFQEQILNALPVEHLSPFFTTGFGRPTKELHTVLGTLILQQAFDLTDEETVNHLAFNIQWHYALNITEESDSAKYMCPKTLWNMRAVVISNDLDPVLFENVTDTLIRVFDVNTDNQRIDSVHIKSNMRRLGRIGIFTRSIQTFLTNLKRGHLHLFETVDDHIIDKYVSEKSLKCFSMIKPSDSHKTLTSVSTDLFNLIGQFRDCPEVCAMYSYKQLERVLNEQCNVVETGEGKRAEVRKPKEIPSDSLQNPSDPDASYSGHKGQGYQVQVMETYSKDEDDSEKNVPNLITYVHVERAHESDAAALMPAVEAVRNRNAEPKEVLADTLYGSDENCQAAARAGVGVVAPAAGKGTDGLGLTGFGLSEDGTVLSCPAGQAPIRTAKKNSRHTAAFDSQCCAACPHLKDCPVKEGKRQYYLRYTDKDIRIAQRRAYEKTDEFTDRYRWRAGVEGTMSQYDRRTGVKKLRVRGLENVRFCAVLKAAAVNIFRASASRKAGGAGFFRILLHFCLIFICEELFHTFRHRIKKIFHAEKCTMKMGFSFQRKC